MDKDNELQEVYEAPPDWDEWVDIVLRETDEDCQRLSETSRDFYIMVIDRLGDIIYCVDYASRDAMDVYCTWQESQGYDMKGVRHDWSI